MISILLKSEIVWNKIMYSYRNVFRIDLSTPKFLSEIWNYIISVIKIRLWSFSYVNISLCNLVTNNSKDVRLFYNSTITTCVLRQFVFAQVRVLSIPFSCNTSSCVLSCARRFPAIVMSLLSLNTYDRRDQIKCTHRTIYMI